MLQTNNIFMGMGGIMHHKTANDNRITIRHVGNLYNALVSSAFKKILKIIPKSSVNTFQDESRDKFHSNNQ